MNKEQDSNPIYIARRTEDVYNVLRQRGLAPVIKEISAQEIQASQHIQEILKNSTNQQSVLTSLEWPTFSQRTLNTMSLPSKNNYPKRKEETCQVYQDESTGTILVPDERFNVQDYWVNTGGKTVPPQKIRRDLGSLAQKLQGDRLFALERQHSENSVLPATIRHVFNKKIGEDNNTDNVPKRLQKTWLVPYKAVTSYNEDTWVEIKDEESYIDTYKNLVQS